MGETNGFVYLQRTEIGAVEAGVGWSIIGVAESVEVGPALAPYLIGGVGAAFAGLISGYYILRARPQLLLETAADGGH